MAETYDDAGASASPSVVAAIWSAAGGPSAPLEARRLLLLERLAVPGPRVDWAAVSDLIDDALVEAGRVDLAAVSDLVDDTLVKAGRVVVDLVEPVDPVRELVEPADPGEQTLTFNLRTEIDIKKAVIRLGEYELGEIDLTDFLGESDVDPQPEHHSVDAEPAEEEIVLVEPAAPADEAAGGAYVAVEAAAPPPAEAPVGEESAGEAAPVEEAASAEPAPVDEAAAPGEAEPAPFWTSERDLTLVEGFAAGDNSSKIAQRLGVKAPDCVRRYRELMPQSGVAAQQRLLKRLRAEAGVA